MNLPINQIICGDNVETLRGFPDDCIDLTVTSPPYDNLRTYGGHSWDFEGVAQQLWRVTKPGGVVVWVVADATIDGSETGTSFRQALRFKEIGFKLWDTMIWEKTKPTPQEQHPRYQPCFEYMFCLVNGCLPRVFNGLREKSICGGTRTSSRGQRNSDDTFRHDEAKEMVVSETRLRRSIWAIRNGGDGNHPAPFPEALARDHILSWSNEGDIVLDPFSGSGTTAKMAKHNGRQFIGIEVNPEYCEIAEERLRQGVLF